MVYRLATKRIFVIVKFNDVTIFFHLAVIIITEVKLRSVGRDSSVGIATGYGLDGSGIEFRCGGHSFHACPGWPRDPPSLLYNEYQVFSGCKERPGRDAVPSPPYTAVGHERVELYLYSPYGPLGLYRASVPVQGCTLPFFYKLRSSV
jgi:hypothetical protein